MVSEKVFFFTENLYINCRGQHEKCYTSSSLCFYFLFLRQMYSLWMYSITHNIWRRAHLRKCIYLTIVSFVKQIWLVKAAGQRISTSTYASWKLGSWVHWTLQENHKDRILNTSLSLSFQNPTIYGGTIVLT